MDVVRSMSSLKELGLTLEGRMPPDKFWALNFPDTEKLK
jgi:hypothetical protein